jgi:glycosyltransferase involved in cell wall biosynthesis
MLASAHKKRPGGGDAMGEDPLKVVADGTALTREPGGARVRFVSLYTAAARRPGLSVAALIRTRNGLEEAFAETPVTIHPAPPLPHPVLRHLGLVHPAPRILKREKADLFAAESIPLPGLRGIPAVLTLHDLRFLHPAFSSPARRAYAALFLRRNLRRAAAVVAVSRATADEILAGGLARAGRVFVVPNAPPLPAARREPDGGLLDAIGVRRPFALCLGRFERRKNVPALLHAFESMAHGGDLQLVLAGAAGGPGGRAVRKRVRSSPLLRNRIVVTGVVDEEVKAALLGRALFFVQPSLYEGFGLGLLEAMTAGVPAACSSIPAHWETAGRAALFFDPRDPGYMARALERLVKEEKLRDDLSAAGARQAACFSWDRSAELLEEVYRHSLR